ncbi:MAG: hypothetical protein GC192_16635 [Bacteroidetes bacterium]|nr:hypothetical protein [Bacteroidota bacterium]
MKLCNFLFVRFLPLALGFQGYTASMDCNCPAVTNVQKTGKTADSFSFSWNISSTATQSKVWYSRREDSFTSSGDFTATTSHTFGALPAGTYTFYVAAVCGAELSDFVGVEDVIED